MSNQLHINFLLLHIHENTSHRPIDPLDMFTVFEPPPGCRTTLFSRRWSTEVLYTLGDIRQPRLVIKFSGWYKSVLQKGTGIWIERGIIVRLRPHEPGDHALDRTTGHSYCVRFNPYRPLLLRNLPVDLTELTATTHLHHEHRAPHGFNGAVPTLPARACADGVTRETLVLRGSERCLVITAYLTVTF